jgi:hypothetical protein
MSHNKPTSCKVCYKLTSLLLIVGILFNLACAGRKKCATYNPDKTYKARYNKKGLIKK